MKKTPSQWAMCPPDYFSVEYEINPWMQGNIGQTHHAAAVQQWQSLHDILSARATVHLIPPAKRLPDMCFTANAGLLSDNIFILSHFKFKERQREEPYFLAWFRDKGYTCHQMPEDVFFEGEGDALFQPDESLLWIGYGMRTDFSSHALISEMLKIDIGSLHLVNPHFYHLDTCFVPLPGKRAIYYPQAFDEASLKKLRAYFPEDRRYEVEAEDAENFSCNAIIFENIFICNQVSTALRQKLHAWGFEVITIPLGEFMLAGGAAKCLVLSLNN
jgi:N-dimethylarginine dimethylaminohydrolase